MNLSVSVLPDPLGKIGSSPALDFRKNPVDEEYDRQTGNDKTIF
jgi:hypothetical protein